MKRSRNKKVCLATFLVAAFALFGAGVATIDSVGASAENVVTAESVGLVMDKGAGVRLGAADGNNGIRFVLTMNKTEYSSLIEKVGTEENDLYSEISFGMIITKASYVSDEKELTVENLFSNEAVFEWKPSDASEDWKVSEGKTLVVNQTFGYLGTSEDYANDYVGFASLVELQDYNLTQEFVARGYMKYTAKDGSINYRMADYYEDARTNNVRSMTYVAQKAAEDPEMSAYVSTLNSLYINHSAVQAQTVDVTVNHHKVDVHGEEISVTPEILTGKTIGATITATPLTEEGWIYDETKSTVSGVAYANNKTVLDLYYNQDPAIVYDWYQVGTTAAATNTLALDEIVTGGIINDEAELELSLDLLSGTMPRIKFYLLTASDAQITDPAVNGWINVADYYDETSGTYKFKTYFKWNSASWDIGKVFLQLEDGEYQLGIDVKSVKVLSDYDVIINKTQAVTYNLPEPVKGAVYGDTAEITLRLTERVTDLTKLHLTLLNKSGETIAHNNNAYYTLADCVTEAENVYKFAMTFPWKGGDWDITAIKFTVDAKTYVVGINVESVEIIPVEYDVKFMANKEHEQQTYTLASPIKALKGDKIEIVFTMTNFCGTTNGASTDIYFYLNDALGNVAVTPGWLELTDILVEGSTYKAVANVNAAVEIYSIKTQVKYAQMSGLNFDSITLDSVDYDFSLNNETTTTYTLPQVVGGMAQYGVADVTLQLVELVGDLTQVQVELLNAGGEVIADNGGEYYTLADCATANANEYTFSMISFAELANYDITAVRLTVDGNTYVVGGYFVEITTSAKEYDFVINKTNNYTYALPETVVGAMRYDTMKVTVELTELVGDLTKLHIQLKNTAGTVVANNDNKYFTLADCATGEDNVYTFALSFPWANGNWDISEIIFTVGDTSHVVGFNVESVELVPVEYDVKFTANTAHEQQTYTLVSPIKAMKGDKIELVFTMTNFCGTTNGASTDVYFYLNDALGNLAVTTGWLELTDIVVEGNQYKAVANVNAAVEIYSIKTQVKYAQMSGLNFDSITLDSVDYDFSLNNETTTTYTLPQAVGGMAQYGEANVTLKLVELSGDLTQAKVELLNADGDVIADNDGEYYTLADCATTTENEYTFSMISFAELANYDITAVRLTVDGETYVVGGYFVEITTSAKEYDFVINKTNNYTYALPETVVGAMRYDTMKVTVELTELVGDLTKLHIQLKNTAGTVVANNDNKYFTLADCATGEDNVYTFALSFPWANGNWDISEIIFTVGDTSHVVGFNVKSVEIVPVEYDLKFTANAAHETQTYTFATPKSALAGDKLEIVFTMTNFYGTTNGTSTDIYFHINNAAGTAVANSGWLELTSILVEGSTYKATATITSAVEVHSIKVQVRYAQKSGLNFNSVSLMSESLAAENFDAFIDGNGWTNNTSGIFALDKTAACEAGNTTVTVKLKLSVVASKNVTQALVRVFAATGNSLCGDSWTKSLTIATGVTELELTRTFAAGVTLNDICRMEILVYGGGTYKIGVDVVSVVAS